MVPHPTGAFTGSVPIKDLPYGWYDVELLAGDEIVGSGAFQVERILKPAYRLEIETGHRAYVAGERIKTTVRATFYEGSPVPGVLLRVENGVDNGVDKRVTTDATGTAVARTVAAPSYVDPDGNPDYQEFIATPRRAEEGQIAGASRAILVFPSNWMITSASEVSGGRVRVSGAVDTLDRDGLERDLEAGVSEWDLDARGDPVSAARVTATFYELIPTKTRTGTTYDFIEKKTVPVYEYGTRERRAGTITFTTDARGRFSVSIPDSGDGHDYRVALRTRDSDGLVTRGETEASASYGPADDSETPAAWLGPTGAATGDYDVGDRIDLTMRDLTHPTDDHSRYLFQVAQRGLRDWTVVPSPSFGSTFDATDVPNVTILGVRFTGTGYIVADPYVASFRSQLRHVDVGLTVDKARYGPRDTVDVRIRTRDANGKPIAATVVLRAIDEKLFTIGAAEDIDPLSELYEPVASGISSTYVSHRSVTTRSEGGDTTGGGGDDRNVFSDSLLFKAVDTDSEGTASVSFRLSDDLTSWRVLASAYTGDLRAGEGNVVAVVGLPFFVDASIAPEYLLADRPTIMLRAFGTALTAHSKVTFSVTSDSLGLRTGPMVSTAFADQPIRLPRLTLGTHSLTITARSGTGSSARIDRLTRTFLVVRSRLTTARTAYVEPSGPTPVDGGDELTEVVVSDASAGRHVPLLVDIADGGGVRLERALAADLAAQLLVDRFGAPEGSTSSRTFDGTRYQNDDGGVGLVPAGGSDLERSALVAIVAPDRFDRAALMDYLWTIRSSAKATRERRVYALSGLAGLGAPVLPSIQEAATDKNLTIRERLMLGLGAAAMGDAATARSIEASLFAGYGEETPVSARIRVGTSAADSSAGTALMAILAADIGDPRAPAFWAYVEANPSSAAVHDLHAIAYVEGLLRWMPVAPVSFAYTIGGKRNVVDLPAGGTFTMNVTPAQLRDLHVETIAGAVGVTTRWREPVKASTIKKDREITVRRSIRPAGIRSGDLVIVDLSVHFGPQAPLGCHEVTELVPSGLVVVGGLEGTDYADEFVPEDIASPYAAAAQRLSFCAENTKRHRTAHLRYVARVITPGTYTWEPTVVGSRTAPDAAGLTPTRIITIR